MSLEKLIEINKHGKRIKSNGITVVGRGVNLRNLKEEKEIVIHDADRSGHFGCFGTTRVGKSRLVENIMEQDIKKGYNVVIIDPKGDMDLFAKMVQVAAEAGRLDEVMMLTPIFPQYSIMLDPLAYYYMQEELVDHVVSGIKAKEDYFIAIAYEVSQAIIAGLILQAEYEKKPLLINFMDIKKRSDYLNLKTFRDTIQYLPGSEDLILSMDQILNSPPDFYAKVASSLRTTLSALTSGSTGQIIGKCMVNEFIRRIETGQGVLLFCNTGSMLARRAAHIVGRVLVSMIQSMMGRVLASGQRLNPPLCLHLDEGHNILYKGIQELFAKGGGANVWVHFYTQSTAQMVEEIGEEATRSILDNINHWVYMLVNHPDTARYIEESSPMMRKYQPILSFGGGISVREMEERSIQAPYVMQLPKRHFYLRSYGQLYRGMTVDSSPCYVRIKMPSLLDMMPYHPIHNVNNGGVPVGDQVDDQAAAASGAA
ncbi:MAG TPA: TraM recognition domain-containing protein [Methanothrix sp.]|nr:TraM recognition domain-containing protein [Methanothrix sp.]HOL44395.1 TraM recognition domain-containing protein [Methanothrix sp.]